MTGLRNKLSVSTPGMATSRAIAGALALCALGAGGASASARDGDDKVIVSGLLCTSGSVTPLPNGSFEKGLDLWAMEVSPEVEGNFVTGPGAGGGPGIQSTVWTTFDGPGYALWQGIDVEPGVTYVLSGWFNAGTLSTGNLYLDLGDEWWEPFEMLGFIDQPGGMMADLSLSGWQFVYQPFTVPDEVYWIRVRAVRDGFCIADEAGFIDEIAVTRIEHFAPPRQPAKGQSSCCFADFNANGAVNSTDVSDFINAWFEDQAQGTLVADWDANGVCNSTDVSEFINSWFEDIAAGCGH